MFWVVQHNLYNEENYETFIKALEENKLQYAVVKVIPFVHTMEPDVNPEGKVVVWGSTTLDYIAKEKGWIPGCYHNDNFNQHIWHEIYGAESLNSDAQFYGFGYIPAFEGPRFIRPVHDLKTFQGMIIDGSELDKWKEQVWFISDGYATLTPETPVSVSKIKEIEGEARFFVVDKKVISGSYYRREGQLMYARLTGGPIWEFAQRMVNRWQPAKAFVIDVAITADGFFVIEINTINSSGFYDCDMTKVVKAVHEMESDGKSSGSTT